MDLAPLCPLWLIPLDRCPSLSCFLLGRRLPAAWVGWRAAGEWREMRRASLACVWKEWAADVPLEWSFYSLPLLQLSSAKPQTQTLKGRAASAAMVAALVQLWEGLQQGVAGYILAQPWIYSVLLTVAAVSSIHCSVCQPCFFLALTFSTRWSILGIIFSSLDTELDRGTSLSPPLPFPHLPLLSECVSVLQHVCVCVIIPGLWLLCTVLLRICIQVVMCRLRSCALLIWSVRDCICLCSCGWVHVWMLMRCPALVSWSTPSPACIAS